MPTKTTTKSKAPKAPLRKTAKSVAPAKTSSTHSGTADKPAKTSKSTESKAATPKGDGPAAISNRPNNPRRRLPNRP